MATTTDAASPAPPAGLDPAVAGWVESVTSGRIVRARPVDRWRPNWTVDVATARGERALFLKCPRLPPAVVQSLGHAEHLRDGPGGGRAGRRPGHRRGGARTARPARDVGGRAGRPGRRSGGAAAPPACGAVRADAPVRPAARHDPRPRPRPGGTGPPGGGRRRPGPAGTGGRRARRPRVRHGPRRAPGPADRPGGPLARGERPRRHRAAATARGRRTQPVHGRRRAPDGGAGLGDRAPRRPHVRPRLHPVPRVPLPERRVRGVPRRVPGGLRPRDRPGGPRLLHRRGRAAARRGGRAGRAAAQRAQPRGRAAVLVGRAGPRRDLRGARRPDSASCRWSGQSPSTAS